MSTRILIVCMGNICRSPMAEGLLRHKIERAGMAERVQLDSAGTGPWHAGHPPDPRAIAVCSEHGIDIAGLRGRQIASGDFAVHDWVLCADRHNLHELQAMAPRTAQPRIALMLAWAGLGATSEIPDPYTGSLADFRSVYTLLNHATELMLARLQLPA